MLADVWVVKANEIGQSDDNVHCKTHLGHLLNIGDSVLGYIHHTMTLFLSHQLVEAFSLIPQSLIIVIFNWFCVLYVMCVCLQI